MPGLAESPWEKVVGQTVLGSERFVARLAASLEQGDSARRMLSRRPGFERVVKVMEQLRAERWEQFGDRYGDPARDAVLHLGRTVCGMRIGELSDRAGIRYMSAATSLRRFAVRLKTDRETGGPGGTSNGGIEK